MPLNIQGTQGINSISSNEYYKEHKKSENLSKFETNQNNKQVGYNIDAGRKHAVKLQEMRNEINETRKTNEEIKKFQIKNQDALKKLESILEEVEIYQDQQNKEQGRRGNGNALPDGLSDKIREYNTQYVTRNRAQKIGGKDYSVPRIDLAKTNVAHVNANSCNDYDNEESDTPLTFNPSEIGQYRTPQRPASTRLRGSGILSQKDNLYATKPTIWLQNSAPLDNNFGNYKSKRNSVPLSIEEIGAQIAKNIELLQKNKDDPLLSHVLEEGNKRIDELKSKENSIIAINKEDIEKNLAEITNYLRDEDLRKLIEYISKLGHENKINDAIKSLKERT